MGLSAQKDIKSYAELCDEINYLISADFPALVNMLYRMDVSEARIKSLLEADPFTDAAKIIADLMLERQFEKMKTRKLFTRDDGIPDDEKW